MSALFTHFKLKNTTLRNRIVVSPMCQYSSVDGVASDWHPAHYTSLARGGAGLVILEATAVSPEGRITPRCAGLWTDEQAQALVPIVRAIKAAGAAAGIQLAHSGRKGSSRLPWEGGEHIANDDPQGWQTLSASPLAAGEELWKVPLAMTREQIARVTADFVAAAIRARDAGFDWLELHFAHGYLAMNFFSHYTNHRTDEYGGTADKRGRLLREIVSAVREVWPAERPLTARFGMVEFDGRDEENLSMSIDLARQFKQLGIDLIDISMGASAPNAQVPTDTPAVLAWVGRRVRNEVGLPVMAPFRLHVPEVAEKVVADGELDLVAIARGMLSNPHWPYHAARRLGVKKPSWTLPAQYAYWLEHYPAD